MEVTESCYRTWSQLMRAHPLHQTSLLTQGTWSEFESKHLYELKNQSIHFYVNYTYDTPMDDQNILTNLEKYWSKGQAISKKIKWKVS